ISDNIDWLGSQRLCKVDHYILGGQTEQNWTDCHPLNAGILATYVLRLIQESDPLKILSWFQKDPERCALSIGDVLKSVRVMEIQDNHLLRGRASNKEVSFYADRLSNLVIAMAHKEIHEKSDVPDPCFAVLGKLSHKSVGLGTNKYKNNPSANVTHVNTKETKYEDSPPSKKTFFIKINKSSNRNELFQKRMIGQEKGKCHQKRFGQDEFAYNLSKEILIYANNVVSVMVVSVMKTMEGQANYSNIACIVLNILLKHSKAMVSDLIDSCMKILHDLAGKLLTNSDFASSVKLTLFTLGSHNAAEIVQAMLNNLHSTLIVQKPVGDNIYTEQSCEGAISGPTKMLTDQLHLGREDSSNAQFIGSLLQKLSSVAVEKGYKVGEILQAMLKYGKERQSGETVGNSVQLLVLNGLLNNSSAGPLLVMMLGQQSTAC
ncbi:LOW QUALITY PROTEIN: A-kinase anchor protein 3, partial [Ciconia maguari]